MGRIEKTVEVDCPMRTVYDRWRKLEAFKRFIEQPGLPDGGTHDNVANPKALR